MYHFKSNITHPSHQLIADKVNYFADCFDFIVDNINEPGFPELENHKSLLEKIKQHLQFYSINSKKYITYHFENKYLTFKDPLIKKFYKPEWTKINRAKNTIKNLSDEVNRKKLIHDLSALIKKLDDSLFLNSLNTIINILHCEEGLEKHNHIQSIEYHTAIIVSEFLFNGFTKDFLKNIFNKILSNDPIPKNLFDENVAPLPESLLEYKENTPDIFYEKAKEYLDKRTLKQQFEGIYYLLKTAVKERTYLFRLNNVTSIESIDLNFDGIRITNQIEKEYVNGNTNDEFKTFFSAKTSFYGQVKILSSDEKSGTNNAIRKLINSLINYNYFIEAQIQFEPNEYIVTCENKTLKHRHSIKPLFKHNNRLSHKYDIRAWIEPENLLAERIFSIEKIFLEAETSSFSDTRISHYWRYIECFFEEDTKGKNIIEKISNILSLHSYSHLSFLMKCLVDKVLSTYLFDGRCETYFNKSYSELAGTMEMMYHSEHDISSISSLINHPYINSRVTNLSLKTKYQKTETLKVHYSNLFFEAYEQRNLIQHSGTFHPKAIDKLLLCFPDFIRTFRRIIVESISTNNFSSFNEVINFLSLESSVDILNNQVKLKESKLSELEMKVEDH
jgi:hypothetical protein